MALKPQPVLRHVPRCSSLAVQRRLPWAAHSALAWASVTVMPSKSPVRGVRYERCTDEVQMES